VGSSSGSSRIARASRWRSRTKPFAEQHGMVCSPGECVVLWAQAVELSCCGQPMTHAGLHLGTVRQVCPVSAMLVRACRCVVSASRLTSSS
jgi:hypothetical protein